jgi:short-subunit dehydrogenase
MTIAPGTALITGATAGIGAEFARQLAARGHDLVLVARDTARLETLASELRSTVAVEVLSADLAVADGLARVVDRVADAARPIEVVVNNAGFGLHTDFDLSPVDDEVRLLEVLVTAPLRLSHAALGAMIPRGHGTIINVTSIAAYAPLGSYSSSKVWLHYFTRWANAFYKPAGITLTALAPGFVRTEFHARMNVERSSMAPDWLWLDVEPLVRRALTDADRGRAVSVPSLRYRVISWVAGAVPMGLVTRAAKRDRWNRG